MPVREYVLSKATRGLREFLNLEVGITRDGATPGHQVADQDRELERLRRLLASTDRERMRMFYGP